MDLEVICLGIKSIGMHTGDENRKWGGEMGRQLGLGLSGLSACLACTRPWVESPVLHKPSPGQCGLSYYVKNKTKQNKIGRIGSRCLPISISQHQGGKDALRSSRIVTCDSLGICTDYFRAQEFSVPRTHCLEGV